MIKILPHLWLLAIASLVVLLFWKDAHPAFVLPLFFAIIATVAQALVAAWAIWRMHQVSKMPVLDCAWFVLTKLLK